MIPRIKTSFLFEVIAVTTVTALTPLAALAQKIPMIQSGLPGAQHKAFINTVDQLLNGVELGVVKDIYMNIPVNETTQPVYGGVVRYYDVAIAQAIAITYKTCTDRNEQGADLHLTAGNQRQINMGKFYISCNLAYDMGIAYGLNEGVSRPVRGYLGDYWKHMPSLNLDTDAKARRFVNFSSNFKPVNR